MHHQMFKMWQEKEISPVRVKSEEEVGEEEDQTDQKNTSYELPELVEQMEGLQKNYNKMESYYTKQVTDLRAQLIEKDNEYQKMTKELICLRSYASEQMRKVDQLSQKYKKKTFGVQFKSASPKFKNKSKQPLNGNGQKLFSRTKNQKSCSPAANNKFSSSQHLGLNIELFKKNSMSGKNTMATNQVSSSQELNQRKKIKKKMTPTRENQDKKTTKKISQFELPSNQKNKKTGINLLREKVPIFK